jgi:hypothetical protein
MRKTLVEEKPERLKSQSITSPAVSPADGDSISECLQIVNGLTRCLLGAATNARLQHIPGALPGKHEVLDPNDEMVPAVSVPATRCHLDVVRLRPLPDPAHTKCGHPARSLQFESLDQTGKNPIGLL